MILRGWEIEGFGVFRGRTLSDIPDGLTLLLGPNEAGKSTLLGFLRFMLFGFPRGEQQKYPPLQGGRHGGRLVFEDEAGLWTLERIQGQPLKLYAPDGPQLGEEGLRSRLGGLDSDTFRSVFAFSLYELTNLATLDREEVRDRLYSAGITGAGRSATSVLAQLRKGAETYLRPRSKEGLINKLSDALVAARRDLGAATAQAGRFGEIQDQLAAAERTVRELGVEAGRLEQQSRHIERLEALYVPWNRLQRLEQELAQESEPPAIDRGTVDRIEAGRNRLFQSGKAMASQADACREIEERIAREEALLDRRLLAVAEPLQAVLQEMALQRDRLGRSERLGRDMATQEGQLAQLASELGVEPTAELPAISQGQVRAADESIDRLRELGQVRARREAEEEAARQRLADAEADVAAIEGQVETYQGVLGLEAYHARDAALTRHKDAIENLSRRRGQMLGPNLLAVALLVVGLAAIAMRAWLFAALAPLGLIAVLFLALGRPGRDLRRLADDVRLSAGELGLPQPLDLAAAAKEISDLHAELGRVTAASAVQERLRAAEEGRGGAHRQLEECRARLATARAEQQDGLKAFGSLNASLGVPAGMPPQHLPSYLRGVQALRAAQGDLVALQAQRGEEERAIAAWEERAKEICRQIGREVPEPREALPETIAALAEPLQAALARETALRLLQEDWRVAQDRKEERQRDQAEAEAALAASLQEAGLADVAAFDRWQEERRAYEQRQHERDLAAAAFRDQVGAAADGFAAELGQGSPEAWQTERRWIGQTLEEIGLRRDLAVRESQDLLRLRGEIAESSDVPTLAARCLELEEELRRAAEAWRAQALAGRLLERTLEVYVQSRQPEVLRTASDAFSRITSGRYSEVRQRSDGQGLLAMPQAGGPKQPDELSRGTQEQLYLALRLGLAASYGDRVAALPLVLDDVAVNFDPARQARLLEVLGTFAAEPGRQALFFTCHPSLAQAAQRAVPRLRVVELDAQEGRAQVAAAADEPAAERLMGLLEPGPLALKEIARLAGLGEDAVRGLVQELVAAGRVRPIGSGRGRRYGLV